MKAATGKCKQQSTSTAFEVEQVCAFVWQLNQRFLRCAVSCLSPLAHSCSLQGSIPCATAQEIRLFLRLTAAAAAVLVCLCCLHCSLRRLQLLPSWQLWRGSRLQSKRAACAPPPRRLRGLARLQLHEEFYCAAAFKVLVRAWVYDCTATSTECNCLLAHTSRRSMNLQPSRR
jgi:hypothetical protein